ncbi:hypothetical protein Pan216_27690 [Planctomycetes bacterium Pan216]|uniref:Uncharacterized protein n=1 Tax=Kolteria novifilia TaxID=2527975 RepID=A0A518B4L9_9BACT|nr:hypothetical protein Pan216_27690 [Planctomycetes bacterium Pan216]
MLHLFSICPRVKEVKGKVVASTGWTFTILTLGTMLKWVTIDPKREKIFITRRYLWLLRFRKTISFKRVRAIIYGYDDLSPGTITSVAHDSLDCFTVGLRLKDESEMKLFRFFGDGVFTNDGPYHDLLYWREYLRDRTGTQERESFVFAEVISELIDAPIDAPRH